MIDRQTFFVYGRITDTAQSCFGLPLAVAAFSNRFLRHELVATTHVAYAGTQYGMNLPVGRFELLVLADQDHDGVLEESEVVGRRHIKLDTKNHPDKVAGNVDVQLVDQVVDRKSADWEIKIPVAQSATLQESLFFPRGSIRDLNDALFDSDMAALGMYEPAAFLEQAPTLFCALEEESYKIPVVFVHGIGGSAREFATIAARLDKQLYKPWFFFYPSGSDLEQLAQMFYRIFLSGQAVPASTRPMIVVAHSMGGLVAREALNQVQGTKSENRVHLLITIASPFSGHPAASMGEKRAPLVLPSWRDLNPDGAFIADLFRKPLPAGTSHHLLYTYANPESIKLGENSDGVVPLASQLHAIAQHQAAEQFGLNSSHTSVLRDEAAIERILQSIDQVGSLFPESHLRVLMQGGYEVGLDDKYSATEKYFIRTMGKYMSLLADGKLGPRGDPVLEHFVQVARGQAEAMVDPETAWLKFKEDYPDYAELGH